MSFMAVMDFTSSEHVDASSYLPLRVERDLEVVPGMEIAITKLNKNGNDALNHFFNSGYTGITFKAVILIKSTDMWNNKLVINVLHDWFKNMTPLSVVTDALNIPDGQYIISKNPSRKQSYTTSTEWELEFTTYTPLTLFKYKNDNTNVLNALKKNKANKNSSSKKKKNTALAKCNYKTLKYSKQKKVVKCVKTLQKILKKKKYYTGTVDGWFGKDTTKAVKKFQKAYNKKNVKTTTVSGVVRNGAIVTANSKTGGSTIVKPKGINKILPENGKVDKATFNALCNL